MPLHPAVRRRARFVHYEGHLPIKVTRTWSLQDRAIFARWRGGWGIRRPVDYRRSR